MATVFGILLACAPFLLVFLFRDTRRGFVSVFVVVLTLHLVTAIVLQALTVFGYASVVAVHALVALVAVFVVAVNRRRLRRWFRQPSFDWVLALVVLITIGTLATVHFNYTGKINTAPDARWQEVEDMSYPYPYFSDEWYAVAFIEDTIEHGTLPVYNPISLERQLFPNLEAPFHATAAELLVLLDLDPLTSYTLLGIGVTTLLVVLVYLVARAVTERLRPDENESVTLERCAAAVGALSLLYITSSGNLPTVWTLIPMSMSLLALLVLFYFLAVASWRGAALASLLVLVLYPPLFVIAGLAIGAYFLLDYRERFPWRTIVYYGAAAVGCVLLLGGIVVAVKGSAATAISFLWDKIWFESFTGADHVSFPLPAIVPIWSVVFAVAGAVALLRVQRWFVVVFVTALIWWAFSAVTIQRLVFSYPRIVYVAAILVVIVGAIGIVYLVTLCIHEVPELGYPISTLVLGVGLAGFVIGSFFYTSRDPWTALTRKPADANVLLMPASPANRYLTQEDLEIFSEISGARFLAQPWKGTVLGVATDNEPVVVKGGTIGRGRVVYERFLNRSCRGKQQIASSFDYVYLQPFSCPGFRTVATSTEGYVLYEVNVPDGRN